METLNTSPGTTAAPGYGAKVDLLSSLSAPSVTPRKTQDSERLMALVSNLEPPDTDLDELTNPDFIDDDEFDFDVTVPPKLESKPLVQPGSGMDADKSSDVQGYDSAMAETEPMKKTDQSVLEEENAADQDDAHKAKMYLIAGGILLVVLVAIFLFKGVSKSKDTQSNNTPVQASSVERFFSDTLVATDIVTYQDIMTVEKYIVLDRDSCQYVFEGYAENARAFIKAYVDLDTYNLYKTGARISVTYERITLNNRDYYMKVRVLHDKN